MRTASEEFQAVLGKAEGAASAWVSSASRHRWATSVALILLGGGAYGAVLGSWRDPWQAVYAGIKLPLVLLGTAGGNALINAVLAPLLGVPLRFGDTLRAVLLSFAVTAVILGSLSPILGFLIWNSPALEDRGAGLTHSTIQWVNFAALSFAGVMGTVRLWHFLKSRSARVSLADRLLLGWLITNLTLGSQLAWILRPFVGSPALPLAFLREDAFQGSFFGSLLFSLRHLFSQW